MAQTDRVKENTAEDVSQRIEEQAHSDVLSYAARGDAAIAQRIEELDAEWDIERILEMNASALAFTGVMLGVFVNRKWLVLPALVTAFLFQHAVQGWCPPLPVFRRNGVRTRGEIDTEKFALKALRGDFDNVPSHDDKRSRAEAAWQAAKS